MKNKKLAASNRSGLAFCNFLLPASGSGSLSYGTSGEDVGDADFNVGLTTSIRCPIYGHSTIKALTSTGYHFAPPGDVNPMTSSRRQSPM